MKHAPYRALEAEPLVMDGRVRLALYTLISVAAVIPLLIVDVPPLVDYPNHLARLHVIAAVSTDPEIAGNYRVAWDAMPNLALEAMTWPVLGLLPVEWLGRMFIVLTFALLAGGTVWLHRLLHGGVGIWPAAAWLFLYNHLLVMGFLGYLFTLGAALLLFAAWIAAERWPLRWRFALFPAGTVALFFGHLFALAVYAVCVAAYEIWKRLPEVRTDWRRALAGWAITTCQFLPAGLVLLATMSEAGERSLHYGPVLAKVRALWSPVLTWYTPIDAALILFALGVLIAGLATRRLVLAPALRLPVAALAALAALMPFWIEGAWGSIWYADLRLPLVLALLLVAGLRPRGISSRTALAVGSAAAVLFTARIADVAVDWHTVDRNFAEFRATLDSIERGTSVLPVQRRNAARDGGTQQFDEAYWNMAMLAVIDRAAFVPTLFTDPTKQPVQAAPRRAAFDTPYGWPIGYDLLRDGIAGNGRDAVMPVDPAGSVRRFWTDWPNRYDYVVVTHFGAAGNPVPDRLALLRAGSFFDLYRVLRPD